MIFDRRPYYLAGLIIGLGVAAFIWFGPKTTPEQRVTQDVAILAQEPWDSVRVVDIVFEGPASEPSDVLLHGVRPNGTPVLVHFAADSPYTARTAVHRLLAQDLDRMAEILMVPRSLVQSPFRDRFRPNATHAGIAYYAGAPPVDESTPAGTSGEMVPESSMPQTTAPSSGSQAPAQAAAASASNSH